jgi:hypothetical protein
VKGKLAPRYVGPYRICQRFGKLAYKVELPEELTGVHPVFHVSQLRKCLQLPEQEVYIDALDIQDTLEYKEHPILILDRAEKETRSTVIPMCKAQWSNHTERVLDRAEKETRSTVIPMCKAQWSNHTEREATWEKESEL